MAFRVDDGKRVVSRQAAQVTLPLNDSKTITRTIRTLKNLRVADVIMGMAFLCIENATIDCWSKRVLFPNDVVV